MNKTSQKSTIFVLCFVLIIFLVFGIVNPYVQNKSEQKKIEIDALPIGEADCILVSNGNTNILIDTGEKEDAPTILEYLHEHQITDIQALIITHFDKDHIGGAEEIVKTLTIEELIIPDYTPEKPKQLEKLKSLFLQDAVITIDLPYQKAINEIELTIWPAQNPEEIIKENIANASEYDNDLSLITKITYDGKRFLLMGDATQLRLNEIMADPSLCNEMECDWIKLPHHGTYNKSLKKFLKIIAPQYAVICSDEIKEKTKKKLEEMGIEYFVTGNDGVHTEYAGKALKIVPTIR